MKSALSPPFFSIVKRQAVVRSSLVQRNRTRTASGSGASLITLKQNARGLLIPPSIVAEFPSHSVLTCWKYSDSLERQESVDSFFRKIVVSWLKTIVIRYLFVAGNIWRWSSMGQTKRKELKVTFTVQWALSTLYRHFCEQCANITSIFYIYFWARPSKK